MATRVLIVAAFFTGLVLMGWALVRAAHKIDEAFGDAEDEEDDFLNFPCDDCKRETCVGCPHTKDLLGDKR